MNTSCIGAGVSAATVALASIVDPSPEIRRHSSEIRYKESCLLS